MATCIKTLLADNGIWITPERCYLKEESAKILGPTQLQDYVLMNVTDAENPKQMDDARYYRS